MAGRGGCGAFSAEQMPLSVITDGIRLNSLYSQMSQKHSFVYKPLGKTAKRGSLPTACTNETLTADILCTSSSSNITGDEETMRDDEDRR